MGLFTPAQGVNENGLTDVAWAAEMLRPASRHTI